MHPLKACMPKHPDSKHSRSNQQLTNASVQDTQLSLGALIGGGNNMRIAKPRKPGGIFVVEYGPIIYWKWCFMLC